MDRLKPSFAPHSRLLIVDSVLRNKSPTPDHTLRDLNMLLIGGKERAEFEWESLLTRGGFELVKIHVAQGGIWTMIEAVQKAS